MPDTESSLRSPQTLACKYEYGVSIYDSPSGCMSYTEAAVGNSLVLTNSLRFTGFFVNKRSIKIILYWIRKKHNLNHMARPDKAAKKVTVEWDDNLEIIRREFNEEAIQDYNTKNGPGTLVGMGNPLLDISASVDNEFLAKYEMKPDDAILASEKHKTLYDDLIRKYNADYIAGGSVQNSFRVAQWVLEKPNVAVFFGSVGVDKYSKILEEKARTDGVDVRYQYCEDIPTGRCGVLITGSHRSLCADLGAANHFKIDHIQEPENRKLIESAEYFYVSGFFLTVSPPSIIEVAKVAHKHNKFFIMNLSAAFISQFYKEPLMAALPYVDLLFGNEAESEAFAKEQNWDTTDLKEIGRRICQLPKENDKRERIAVITQGHDPVLLIQGDKIEEFPVDELLADEIVDTNGAGDAFVGGFLAQFVQKKPLAVCVRCGIWAARQIIQRSGCTFEGKPSFQES